MLFKLEVVKLCDQTVSLGIIKRKIPARYQAGSHSPDAGGAPEYTAIILIWALQGQESEASFIRSFSGGFEGAPQAAWGFSMVVHNASSAPSSFGGPTNWVMGCSKHVCQIEAGDLLPHISPVAPNFVVSRNGSVSWQCLSKAQRPPSRTRCCKHWRIAREVWGTVRVNCRLIQHDSASFWEALSS